MTVAHWLVFLYQQDAGYRWHAGDLLAAMSEATKSLPVANAWKDTTTTPGVWHLEVAGAPEPLLVLHDEQSISGGMAAERAV